MYIVLINKLGEENETAIPEGSRSLGVNAANEHVFDAPVNVAPTGFRAAVKADVAALPMTKARQAAINAARDKAIDEGVEVEGIGLLNTGSESQMRQTAALLLTTLPMTLTVFDLLRERAVKDKDQATIDRLDAAKKEVQIPWIKHDNSTQSIGFAELKAFGEASAAHVSEKVHTARKEKDAVASAVLAASKKAPVAVVSPAVEKPAETSKADATTEAAPADEPKVEDSK